MTCRAPLVTIVLLAALAGCRKPPATTAIPGAGPPPPPSTAPVSDYRTLSVRQLEALIRDKTSSPVTLQPAGPNKYTGTTQSPDGTTQLAVTVTVEAERIVIDTTGGGLSTRDVITPRGLEAGTLR